MTHIWFRPLEYALNSFSMELAAFLEEFARSGQAGELNDIKCIGFMMDISGHPLQDPSLRISIVAFDVESGIKLKQKLFVPVLFISHERQQTHLPEAIQGFLKTWQTSNGFNLKALVREDATLVV